MKLDYRLPLALAGAAILTFSGLSLASADEPGTIPTDCAELEGILAGLEAAVATNAAADAIIADPESTPEEKAAALASKVQGPSNSAIFQTRNALENCVPTPEEPVEEEPAPETPAGEPVTEEPVEDEVAGEVYYENCDDAINSGAAPVYADEPGYRAGLDRDSDGIGCEEDLGLEFECSEPNPPAECNGEEAIVVNEQFKAIPNTGRGIDTGGL